MYAKGSHSMLSSLMMDIPISIYTLNPEATSALGIGAVSLGRSIEASNHVWIYRLVTRID